MPGFRPQPANSPRVDQIAISSFGLQIVSTFIRTDADSADVDDSFYVQTSAGGAGARGAAMALVAHMEHQRRASRPAAPIWQRVRRA